MVSLLTTYADTGTGAHTILCQMIAEVLDIPFSRVRLEVGTTDCFRSESGTGASRVTFVLGQAVLNAADKLKALLRERAAEMLGVSSAEIVMQKGRLASNAVALASLSLAQVAAAAAAKGGRLEVESYFAGAPKHRPKEFSLPASPKSMSTSRPVKSICANWTRFMTSRRF